MDDECIAEFDNDREPSSEGYRLLPEAEYTVIKARNHDELQAMLNDSLLLGWKTRHYAVASDGSHFAILARNTQGFVDAGFLIARQLEDGNATGVRAARYAEQLRVMLDAGLFKGYPKNEQRLRNLLT